MTIDPTNNKLIKTYENDSPLVIQQRVKNSHLKYLDWKKKPLDDRLSLMKKLAENLKSNIQDLSETFTKEMGKPIHESQGEIEKSIKHINYYISHSAEMLHSRSIHIDHFDVRTVFEPLGPILSICPWNYPLWVAFKSIIPLLISGNTVILKPAENIPLSAIKIKNIFDKSGFDNEFQITFANHEDIEKNMIANPQIRGVIFTGSTKAGALISEQSGRNLKKSVLELGGSDPFIVLENADLDKTVKFAAEGRLRNSGQACICAKRFIVHEKIYNEFIHMLKNHVDKHYHMGDPMNEKNRIGPLARLDLFLNLKRQVISSVETGKAKLLFKKLEDVDQEDYQISQGNYFEPLYLTDIQQDSCAAKEELFGPVFSFYKFKNDSEAIDLANCTEYGLGASIFSEDLNRADLIANQIETGMAFVNSSTFSDSRIPYGGTKNSGFGRTSAWTIFNEFSNLKVISRKLN